MFSLHVLEENRTALESFLKSNANSSLCSSRVTILALVATPSSFFHSHFPINILRNVGIRNVQTSHYLLLDTDIMVSPETYPELLHLLSSFQNTSRTAIVLPVFFSTTTVLEGSLETQLLAGLQSMPQNTKQLGVCILSGNCSSHKRSLFTHVALSIDFHEELRSARVCPWHPVWPGKALLRVFVLAERTAGAVSGCSTRSVDHAL